jgi:hypothetical protein
MPKEEIVTSSTDAPRLRWQTPELVALGRVADLARDERHEPKDERDENHDDKP